MKRRPRSQQSRETSFSDVTTKAAFVKGYKTALKEALKMISTEEINGGGGAINCTAGTLDKKNIASDRSASKSKMSRTLSNDSRLSSRRGYTEDSNFDSCSILDYGHSTGMGSNRLSSRRSSMRSSDRKLSCTSRRTNKLSFRPSSRPGQSFFDDVYDGYRSDSSVPVDRARFHDFEFSRKVTSRNSTRFRSKTSDSTEDLYASDAPSKFGRPSTRSRLSSTLSQPLKGDNIWKEETDSNGAFSENERHFYNKLNLERPRTASPISNRNLRHARNVKRDLARPRSQSAIAFYGHDTPTGRRSANEVPKDDREVVWYMGDDPVYDGYDESWNEESSSYPGRTMHRSSSFSDQSRLGSTASSKRKSVTFDKRPKVKEMTHRRTFKH